MIDADELINGEYYWIILTDKPGELHLGPAIWVEKAWGFADSMGWLIRPETVKTAIHIERPAVPQR